MMSAAATAKESPTPNPPIIIIHDSYESGNDDDAIHRNKRAKTTSSSSSSNVDHNKADSKKSKQKQKQQQQQPPRILHPESNKLLDDMLHPLPKRDFLKHHFRKDAVCIQRQQQQSNENSTIMTMVSDICSNYLFDLDAHQIFAETSSENVFLWLSSPSSDSTTTSTKAMPKTLNSVEISDPETAYALHKSGCHPAYCRAPPILEHHLVNSLLRATGLGGGHYHPPHVETVTLGGGTTLGRGEVELFIGAALPSSSSSTSSTSRNNRHQSINGSSSSSNDGGSNVGSSDEHKSKKHTTGWHTDFQENFTIQLSGIKRWTLRRGRVRHPLRGTTPHYARDASVVENQLKVARLSCLGGNAAATQSSSSVSSSRAEVEGGGNDDGGSGGSGSGSSYGFEYGENNAYGPEQTITLHPGDVLYFPSGMWHRVETVEPGVSLNVSLMGTTYATLVCESLQHLMVGMDEGWREVVTSRPGEGGAVAGVERLQGLLGGLSKLVDDFVNKQGGAQSLLPPALCHPPLGHEEEEECLLEDESGDEIDEDCDSNEEDDQSSKDERSEPMNGRIELDSDEDDDVPSSGIVIPIDDFEGPSGWICPRPANSKLVKNPLASLISMSDIAGHHQQKQSLNGNMSTEDTQEELKKRYVLNVNFAGNEMMESHIRVILETAEPKLIDQMDWYLECEAQGHDVGRVVMQNSKANHMGHGVATYTPPLCLFYYGYLSWNDTAV